MLLCKYLHLENCRTNHTNNSLTHLQLNGDKELFLKKRCLYVTRILASSILVGQFSVTGLTAQQSAELLLYTVAAIHQHLLKEVRPTGFLIIPQKYAIPLFGHDNIMFNTYDFMG